MSSAWAHLTPHGRVECWHRPAALPRRRGPRQPPIPTILHPFLCRAPGRLSKDEGPQYQQCPQQTAPLPPLGSCGTLPRLAWTPTHSPKRLRTEEGGQENFRSTKLKQPPQETINEPVPQHNPAGGQETSRRSHHSPRRRDGKFKGGKTASTGDRCGLQREPEGFSNKDQGLWA